VNKQAKLGSYISWVLRTAVKLVLSAHCAYCQLYPHAPPSNHIVSTHKFSEIPLDERSTTYDSPVTDPVS